MIEFEALFYQSPMDLIAVSYWALEMCTKFQNPHFSTWAPAGEGGELPPPPETEKIVVEKWCYFPELYKMTKVREDGIENGKSQFSIEIFICKFQNFLNKFQSRLVFSQNAQKFYT